MQIEKFNLKEQDIDLNKKSFRIYINADTFKEGTIPIRLTKTNVQDINNHKRFITITPDQVIKTGGAIPLLALVPALAGLFGGVASSASSIANAVNSKKKMEKELEEQKRHNMELEKSARGGGFALKKGKGYVLKKKLY
jgi:hypothetical protein